MKKNDADNLESMQIYLTKISTPIAFEQKVLELIKSGMNREEAEIYVETTPFEMEFYYSPDRGLFMVESEAVDSTEIFDPYTGEEMEAIDEE